VLIDRAQLIGLFHASAEQIKSDASVIPFAAALARYNRSVVRKIIRPPAGLDRLERIARRRDSGGDRFGRIDPRMEARGRVDDRCDGPTAGTTLYFRNYVC